MPARSTNADVPAKRRYAARMPVEQRREAILDAALVLVTEGGVATVTMEAVARQADVTKPVVYTAFRNADAVLEALVEREQRDGVAQLRALLSAGSRPCDPVGATSAVILGYFSAVRENPARWGLLLKGRSLPDSAAAAYQASRQWAIGRLVDLAGGAQANRRGEPLDAELLAELALAGMEAGARLILADPDAYDEERIATFTTEVVRSVLEG